MVEDDYSFFFSVCTTWMLTKWLKKKLNGNFTRMLWAILNKSWWQHPTRHQLYGHLPPIMKTIQVRWTRHAGHCWRSKDELISDVLLCYVASLTQNELNINWCYTSLMQNRASVSLDTKSLFLNATFHSSQLL